MNMLSYRFSREATGMEENRLEKAKEKAMEKVIKEYFKEYFQEDLGSERGIALKHFFEEMLNEIMRAERTNFLEKDQGNKGNGYYNRDLVTGSLKLHLDVPHDRQGKFRPQILPSPYQRADEEYTDLLMSSGG
jgi:transposase-like protein